MYAFFSLLLGLSYLIVWIFFFILNFYLFTRFAKIPINKELFEDQNEALWDIIKWQLIGQAIMFGSLIYYFWTNIDTLAQLQNGTIDNFLIHNFWYIFLFGFLWIILFQWTLIIIGKLISFEKEILLDENKAFWKIIEWLLISMSILISLSLYSY